MSSSAVRGSNDEYYQFRQWLKAEKLINFPKRGQVRIMRVDRW
jgi:hypothetical protein